MKQLATIYINDLQINCILGVGDVERSKPQTIAISLAVLVDATMAIQTDMVADTVNYSTLKQEITAFVSQSNFHLLESLAAAVVALCLHNKNALSVTVKVTKLSRNVTVEMTKTQ